MKMLLAMLALLIAVPAMALDIAKLETIQIEPVENPGQSNLRNGNCLVISVTKDIFTDGGPAWVAALEANGYVADLYYDPQTYGWPDISGYKLVVVVFNDNWWYGYWSGADEAVLAGYGGGLAIVGQDYIYAVGLSQWLRERFDIASVVEDVNYGSAAMMTLLGSAGGPFDGKEASGFPCWEANPWFTDDVTPGSLPTQDWVDDYGYSGHGGAAVADGIFSVNAYECFDAVEYWVGDLAAHLKGGTPTRESTWSQLKGTYR